MSENQAINPRQKCRDIMTKNPTAGEPGNDFAGSCAD